jgi:inhibitor of cysteine peptidase
MSRVIHGLCVGATVILLASCGAPAPASVQVREQDAGRTVELRRGGRLDILLDGNPTTGYAWEQVDGDSAVIAPAGEPTFTPASSALGSGGTLTMPYIALAAGRTRLQLAYRRRFETGVPPLKTFAIEVVVT